MGEFAIYLLKGVTAVMSCLIRIERLYLTVNYIYLVTSPFRRLLRLTGESGVTQKHGQKLPSWAAVK